MGIEFAFVLWIIIVVVVFFIVRSYGVHWWSAIVFALLTAWVLLAVLFPWDNIFDLFRKDDDHHRECDRDECDHRDCGRRKKDCTGAWLFCFIGLLTVVVVVVYLIQRVFRDRDTDGCNNGKMSLW